MQVTHIFLLLQSKKVRFMGEEPLPPSLCQTVYASGCAAAIASNHIQWQCCVLRSVAFVRFLSHCTSRKWVSITAAAAALPKAAAIALLSLWWWLCCVRFSVTQDFYIRTEGNFLEAKAVLYFWSDTILLKWKFAFNSACLGRPISPILRIGTVFLKRHNNSEATLCF